MKNVLFISICFALLLVSCSKDTDSSDDSKSVNYFVNTYWEYSNTQGMVMSLNFNSETECRWGADLPLFAPDYTFYNYTYNEYNANIIDKQTGKTSFVCNMDGNSLTIEGRSEIFKRIN